MKTINIPELRKETGGGWLGQKMKMNLDQFKCGELLIIRIIARGLKATPNE